MSAMEIQIGSRGRGCNQRAFCVSVRSFYQKPARISTEAYHFNLSILEW